MPFTTGTAPTADVTGTFREKGYQKLFRAFRRYVTGSCTIGTFTDPAPANTGNGVIQLFDTKPAGVAQTWTFTCTTAGASAVFSVTGSVSGAMASLTINTNYENTHIAVRIEGGGTNFVVGDNFTVVTTAGAVTGNDKWIIDAYDYFALNGVNGAALGTPNHEIVMHGVGLAGTEAVYVGIRLSETPASSLYHWELRGLTGFSASSLFASQPGISPTPAYMSLWDQSIPFWFVVNGRRFVVATKVSTTYHGCYGGFFLPFATPSEYPYPIVVGADDDVQTVYTSTLASFSTFPDPKGSMFIRDAAGAWHAFINDQVTPSDTHQTFPYDDTWDGRTVLLITQNLPSGEYPLFPVNIVNFGGAVNTPLAGSTIGVLDGVFATTGFGLTAETLITVSSVDYVAIQNIFRTTRDAYWALKLA